MLLTLPAARQGLSWAAAGGLGCAGSTSAIGGHGEGASQAPVPGVLGLPPCPGCAGGVWGPSVTGVAVLAPSHPTEAAAGAHHLHPLAVGRAGGTFRQDPLPRHLHEGGSRPEDQPARIPSPGTGLVRVNPAPSWVEGMQVLPSSAGVPWTQLSTHTRPCFAGAGLCVGSRPFVCPAVGASSQRGAFVSLVYPFLVVLFLLIFFLTPPPAPGRSSPTTRGFPGVLSPDDGAKWGGICRQHPMQDLSPEPVRCHCARGMHKLGRTLQPLALGHPCSGQNAGWPGCQAGQVFYGVQGRMVLMAGCGCWENWCWGEVGWVIPA